MCHYLILIKHRLHVYICLLSFLTSIKIIIIKKRFRFFFEMHPYTFIFCYWHSPIIINRNLEIFSSSRTSLIIICLVKHCSEPYKININEDLPIKLEKKLNRKEVSIGDQKGNSVFYSDTVTSSNGKKTAAKTSAIEYSADKYNEQIALNNFTKELIVEIKQRLLSTECSKTSENNSVYVYIASLKDQIQ